DDAASEVYAFSLVVEPAEPTLSSIVTDPANDRLVVSFTAPVTCPDTTEARATWDFYNPSVEEDGSSQASGAPDSVSQPDGGPDEDCYLEYSSEGIEDGDFGRLDYEPSGGADDVHDDNGWELAAFSNEDVVDFVAPTFESVEVGITTKEDVLTLTFSEPILCSSIGESDFELEVNGQLESPTSDGFICSDPAASTFQWFLESGSVEEGDEVKVTIAEMLFDESKDNTVSLGEGQQDVVD
ncbi:MAG: hypothetical protein ACLFRD_09960, partial [Nitriliruptoraceae bacterium]